MRVAIVGSREFPTLGQVSAFVTKLAAKYPNATIVSGGARGVDRTAESAALMVGLSCISFRPHELPDGRFGIMRLEDGVDVGLVPAHTYQSFGRAAFGRNVLIAEESERVVAFTTGSQGTAHTLQIARELRRPVHVYGPFQP